VRTSPIIPVSDPEKKPSDISWKVLSKEKPDDQGFLIP
jgi:hypothetical protein